MRMFIDRLTQYCLSKNIIKDTDIAWFQYGIEKRISTLLVGIPFFCLAVYVTDFISATTFFVCFYLVRRSTGGYHARSQLGCICFSLCLELLFLMQVYVYLKTLSIIGLSLLCSVIIWSKAPYNHPDMNFTAAELTACRKFARKQILVILGVILISLHFGMNNVARGATTGVAMATLTLCLGYITEWRIRNNDRKRKNECLGKTAGKCND